ncbi:FAD-binding and (Fe-S)-binding domain-containing protein [Nocardia bovistercoris]|uniref:FAD-binding protein n=1 Tax=Nocardia bovistercoris TaxID=2785916 RepID=A0A931IE26_9NOCA|nr:FAD-binding and (Fe-S)-binding domain-containing protein [Nocardia bovistercoris]MBH0779754.1 FAD-binding protein [Nocardia bovistercoris]
MSSAHRAAYSSDASLYRVAPRAIVRPRDTEEVAATVEVCRELEMPVTARGAGTSVAGNAVGAGVVIDFSRHMNRVLDLDAEARRARVQPGTVHATLQAAAQEVRLRFGPDPSTHTRCTIGGMIGNNACGSRTLGYGRTVDNVEELDALTMRGERFAASTRLLGPPGVTGAARVTDELRRVIGAHLAVARTEFATFGRQVSGYAVDNLLPERGFDVGGLLVGSEGTLAIVTEATVRLVADPAHRLLVVLGYADFGAAGDAVPTILTFGPTACEGIDARIVEVVTSRRGPGSVPPLPNGRAWLFVELSGDTEESVRERAAGLVAACAAIDAAVVHDTRLAASLWRIREDGAGLAGRAPSGLPAYAGWEDAAVPPARIGDYLRSFDELVRAHGLTAMPYGHLGDGCVHVRLDFPLTATDGTRRFREFLVAAADLVVGFGGSLSGEHGDGRARGELLPRMYSPAAIGLFGAVKAAFDPDGLLNPGVMVDPDPMDAGIRVAGARPVRERLALAYHGDNGDFGAAVHRCTGVGKCRADSTASGGVMCPSYLATRDEKDSTRGRARVLQEMLDGELADGWRSEAVHDALDLCLSCKGCASDCPTGIDMAAYKSEVLHQSYRGRMRPRSHYALGWLPRWSRLAASAPRLVNRMMGVRALRRPALWLAGVDSRRSLPAFADQTFRKWFVANAGQRRTEGRPVVLFVDSFTDHFAPQVAMDMVRVLEAAGYRPRITERATCCALTWITTGQLDAARRILGRTLDQLGPALAEGTPIVGIEPSCTGVLRGDLVELIDTDDSRKLAAATVTLAELLTRDESWQAPSLRDVRVIAQPHCHHHAVMGWQADERLLADAGAELVRLGGCCGLAGNFGVEIGHYEVSTAVAANQLLPALEAAGAQDVLLADGFSCRTQAADLADRDGVHLAQLLARRLPDAASRAGVESTGSER